MALKSCSSCFSRGKKRSGEKEENRKFGFCLSIFFLWKACYSSFQLSYKSKLSISFRDFEMEILKTIVFRIINVNL